MAQVRHIVTAPGKKPVEFFAPDGADDAQLQQLASQALSKAFTGETFVTPVLDAATRKSLERAPRKLMQDEILSRQGDLSAPEPTLADAAVDRIRETMIGWGMDPRTAQREASNIASGASFLPGPGTAVTLDDARIAAKEGRYGAAAGNVLAAGLDVIPGVGKGASALAMFLGRNAKTANLDMLRKAEQMAEQGIDPGRIRRETGWFNQHGDWKFEISDQGLKLNMENLPKWGEKVPLRNVVSHPELEAAYPEAWPNLKFQRETNPDYGGSWNDHEGVLKLGYRSDDKMRSTGAHELQHFVQHEEGFPTGGYVPRAEPDLTDPDYLRLKPEWERLSAEYNRLRTPGPDYDLAASDEIGDKVEDLWGQMELASTKPRYMDVAGEVEARNVQARLNGSPEQRLSQPWWATQDVPDHLQVVRREGGIAPARDDLPLSADPPGTVPTANALTGATPGKQAMATAKALSGMAGSPAGGGKKLTTRQIKKLSEDYLRQVEQGAAGAPWYEQSGRSMMFHMGEREPLAVKFAGATGITSSQTPVLTNLEHAVRGHNQAMMGDPVRTGMFPTAMGRDIEGIYSAPDMTLNELRNLEDPGQFGMKRTPFIQQNLMYEGFEPGQASTARAVHDIWDMRARGYQGPGGTPFSTSVSPAQHRWADIQDQGYLLPEANYRMLGNRADWDTGRAQAAAWVGNKIDALMKEGKTFEEAQQIAITDYSHGFDRLYANHSWESAPGSNTGHMAGFDDLPWEAKQQYHDEAETAFLNPEGQSRIALGYGLPTGRSYDTTGLYEGVVSPGTQDRIAVARAPGSQEIDPSSAKAMDAVAATQGLLGAQKGAAWNFQSPAKSSIKGATGFRFDMDRTLSLEDIEKYGPMIQQAFPAGNVGLLPDPAGMKVVKLWDEPGDDLPGFIRQMTSEGDVGKPFPTTQSGNYMENAWDTPEGRFGGQYVNVLRGLDVPDMARKFDSFAPDIARKMGEIDPILMKEAGLAGSADIDRLRKTIANEGWQGLVKLVESQKGSVDAKAALLAAIAGIAGLAGLGVGVETPGEAQR